MDAASVVPGGDSALLGGGPIGALAAEDVEIELQQGVSLTSGGMLILATTIHSSLEPPNAWLDIHAEGGSDRGNVSLGSYNIFRLGDDDYAVFLDEVTKGRPDTARLRMRKRDPKVAWTRWLASMNAKKE